MRFVLDGKTYNTDAVANLSLADVLQYESEAKVNGWPSWAEVEQAMGEAQALPQDEMRRHPGTMMWLALATWRARREGGERLTYAESIESLPILDQGRFWFLPDPVEEAADPQMPRPDSGRGASGRRVAAD